MPGMALADLTTPLTILVVGFLAFTFALFYMRQNTRLREIEIAERRADKEREEERRIRLEQRERERFYQAQDPIYARNLNDYVGPEMAGDYFTLTFNKGPDISATEFDVAIEAALHLPRDLARIGRYEEDGTLEVRVHRARYENPLELVLLVGGASVIVSAVVLWARQLNGATQEIRRSWTETDAVLATHGEITSRAKLKGKIYDAMAAAIDEEDDDARARQLQRLEQVAEIAARHDLISMTHADVPALDSRGKEIQQIPGALEPPKQLGAGG